MTEYTQGVCQDGAAILKDGEPMTPDEIIAELGSSMCKEDIAVLISNLERALELIRTAPHMTAAKLLSNIAALNMYGKPSGSTDVITLLRAQRIHTHR